MTTKQLNITNKTYYFYNDLINVLNFKSENLKLYKKTWKDIDIYYIGYVEKNKPSDWKVNSMNPLYLMVNNVDGTITEKNGFKFVQISSKSDFAFERVFSAIKENIGKISKEKVNFNIDYNKITFSSDDSLPLGKDIYFHTLTVVIRCVFKQDGVYYPQVYLDDALY